LVVVVLNEHALEDTNIYLNFSAKKDEKEKEEVMEVDKEKKV